MVFLNHKMINFTIQFIDELAYVSSGYFEIYDYLMIVVEEGDLRLTDGSECVIIYSVEINTLKEILEEYINKYKTGNMLLHENAQIHVSPLKV